MAIEVDVKQLIVDINETNNKWKQLGMRWDWPFGDFQTLQNPWLVLDFMIRNMMNLFLEFHLI
jgi:hypothetical protein